jgi:hypothetical protein
VVEIAEEFIEAVNRWQILVAVTQMILAELSCRVTNGFKLYNRRM